jgi:hypothetical protein
MFRKLNPNNWTIGSRSVAFGAHCFLTHWYFVARGWICLYGFPLDPRIWCAFALHDVGYIGMPNMDGDEGEAHVFGGAKIMAWLFDYGMWNSSWFADTIGRELGFLFGRRAPGDLTWYCFTFYHSRFMAKRYHTSPSPLCYADKLVPSYEPWWFYLPRVRLTGELREYMGEPGAPTRQASAGWVTVPYSDDPYAQRLWYRQLREYMVRWVFAHKDGKADTWTPASR